MDMHCCPIFHMDNLHCSEDKFLFIRIEFEGSFGMSGMRLKRVCHEVAVTPNLELSFIPNFTTSSYLMWW
jgi:hypothetical protein